MRRFAALKERRGSRWWSLAYGHGMREWMSEEPCESCGIWVVPAWMVVGGEGDVWVESLWGHRHTPVRCREIRRRPGMQDELLAHQDGVSRLARRGDAGWTEPAREETP